MNMGDIRTDGGTQTRATLNDDTIRDYVLRMIDGDTFPSVVVFYDGSDYWLADGFHRVAAAQQANRVEIETDVKQGTRRDAILYSVGANSTHGLRRSNEDKRRAVLTLLNDSEWGKWSDNEIARRCGVAPDTANRIRKEIALSLSVSDSDRTYTNRYGQVSTMQTVNIGRTPETPIAPPPLRDPEIPFTYDETSDPDETTIVTLAVVAYCPICDRSHDDWDKVTDADGEITYGCRACWSDELDYRIELTPAEWDAALRKPIVNPGNVSDNPDYDGDEWYTPQKYIEAARLVLGVIDLDPASCEYAQRTVSAIQYYTIADDGLQQDWHGNVWLNPPYSSPKIQLFTAKLVAEYDAGHTTAAILLVNNCTDTDWFQTLLKRFPACFTDGRVNFERPDRKSPGARQGQVFFYLGDNTPIFCEYFAPYGIVVGAV